MIKALTITIIIFISSIIFSIIYNYIRNKEFKNLIRKIKRIALSPEKTNKAIQIKNILADFFIEEN